MEKLDFDKVFQRAYEITISGPRSHEGGFGKNQFDSGGTTYFGIARNHHPDWEGWYIIDSQIKIYGKPNPIFKDRKLAYLVKHFYFKEFWENPRLDEVAPIFPAGAIEMFDTGINCGTGTAVKMLQKTLNLMNRRATYWPDIKVDHGIGPVTLGTLKTCLVIRGKARTYNILNYYQAKYYIDLMEAAPQKYEEFIGWFNRVNTGYEKLEEGL